MTWIDVISATHGVFFTSQDQVEAWKFVIRRSIPDLKKGEIEKALYEAMDRNEKTKEYRMTAGDVSDWVKRSRNNWGERTYVKDGRVYFPDRERICGQIQFRKATEADNASLG